MCHGVYNSQQSIGECHACQTLCIMHFCSCSHAAVKGFLQFLVNHLNGVQSNCIGIITVQSGNICFNCMRHGIHTSMCNQLLRHGFCQCTINNGNIRRNVEVCQRILDTLVIVGDNRECGYFGCRTGCRRNCTELCLCPQCREIKRCAKVFKLGIRIFIECPHCLCSIDRRTAAHGNNPIRLKFPHLFCTL